MAKAVKRSTSSPRPRRRRASQPKPRGLAAMSKRRRREIASLGGKAVHGPSAWTTGHEFTSAQAKQAGAKGGKKTARSRGKAYMRAIGRKGGRA
jgi:general stress protein YciG